jgi:hypothetical protein
MKQLQHDLASLEVMGLPYQHKALAQMFLVLREYLRDAGNPNVCPLEDWTLADVIKILPKEAA